MTVCVFPACALCVTVSQQQIKHVMQLRHSFCLTRYLSVHHTHVHENTNAEHTQTHRLTTTSLLLLPSCEGFDIRLPAADAAAANANAAQSLKQQWKTATHMTQRHTLRRSCHPGRITEENTHSSVSPGILSLSRWAFMAELCSFALLWSWYAFTLPACLPPPPALTKSQTQPPQCDETDWFSLPQQKGRGLKKGGLSSCFGLSTFHLEAVKWDPQSPAEGIGGRTIPRPPSPNTRPLLLHMHICVPHQHNQHHNSPTSWWVAT